MNWQRLFRELIGTGDTVLDIGAYKGGVSEFCSELVGPNGRVVAFEPRPDHYKYLVKRKLPSVVCENKAVAASAGRIDLYWSTAPKAEMASTTVPALANRERLGGRIRKTTVETVSIDGYCAAMSLRPKLIKIDVEGAEHSVLQGGLQTFMACSPAIYFEQEVTQAEVPRSVEFLRELGYEIAISDFFKFTDPNNIGWGDGMFLTSECQALEEKLVSFTDVELVRHRPMLTNMIAIRQTSANLAHWECGRIHLDEAVRLLVQPALPRKNAMFYAKQVVRAVLPRTLHTRLWVLFGRK